CSNWLLGAGAMKSARIPRSGRGREGTTVLPRSNLEWVLPKSFAATEGKPRLPRRSDEPDGATVRSAGSQVPATKPGPQNEGCTPVSDWPSTRSAAISSTNLTRESEFCGLRDNACTSHAVCRAEAGLFGRGADDYPAARPLLPPRLPNAQP